ncbi:unnamed protein product, partial [Mesorhabditis spiculigera]
MPVKIAILADEGKQKKNTRIWMTRRIVLVWSGTGNVADSKKRGLFIKPASKVIVRFAIMINHAENCGWELIDDHGPGMVIVDLNGRINKCPAILP